MHGSLPPAERGYFVLGQLHPKSGRPIAAPSPRTSPMFGHDRAPARGRVAGQAGGDDPDASLPWMGGERPGPFALLAIFLPFAAGYFISYLFRSINGPMADHLIEAFDLGPRELGSLTAAYFLTFAAFQIPAGCLIDRFGPRRVQMALLAVAAAGSLVCALASNYGEALLGRALIGLGCSGAFVTGVKMIAVCLPPNRRALATSCLVMCGGLGAITSTIPLEWLAASLGMRAVFGLLAAATLAIFLLVWHLVPNIPIAPGTRLHATVSGLRAVLRDRRFWRIAPLSGSVVGAAFAIHGLWAARYLSDVARLSPHAVNLALLGMGVMLTLGALLLGTMATILARFGVRTTTVFAGCCALSLGIEAWLASGSAAYPALLFGVFAIFGAMTVLSFTIVAEMFPQALAGRANGALNVFHLGTAFLMQAAIGAIVSCWQTQPDGHPPAIAYSAAFGCVVLFQGAALVWFMSAPRPSAAWVPRRGAYPAPIGVELPASGKLASWPRLDRHERAAVRISLLLATVILVALAAVILLAL